MAGSAVRPGTISPARNGPHACPRRPRRPFGRPSKNGLARSAGAAAARSASVQKAISSAWACSGGVGEARPALRRRSAPPMWSPWKWVISTCCTESGVTPAVREVLAGEAGRRRASCPARAGVDQHALAAHVDEEAVRRWRASCAPSAPGAASPPACSSRVGFGGVRRRGRGSQPGTGRGRRARLVTCASPHLAARGRPAPRAGAAAGARAARPGAAARLRGGLRRRSARRRRSSRASARGAEEGLAHADVSLVAFSPGGRPCRVEQPVGVDDEVAHQARCRRSAGPWPSRRGGRGVVRDRRRRNRPWSGRGTRAAVEAFSSPPMTR